MSCRFWVISPTTAAPAVWASPRISSHGSSDAHGRSGKATLTRMARSWRTESSSRVLSNEEAIVANSFARARYVHRQQQIGDGRVAGSEIIPRARQVSGGIVGEVTAEAVAVDVDQMQKVADGVLFGK